MQLSVPTAVDDADVGAVEQQHLNTLRTRLAVLRYGVVERRQSSLIFVVRRRSEVQQRLFVDTMNIIVTSFRLYSCCKILVLRLCSLCSDTVDRTSERPPDLEK